MTSLLALLALALPNAMAASAYNAHGFTLVPSDGDLLDPLAMWRPEVQVRRSFGINALVEFAKAPLVLYTDTDNGVTEQAVLDNLLGLNIGGAYALNRRLALSLAMPIWANAEDVSGDSHAALGDIRFAVPIGLILPSADKDGQNDPNTAGFMLSVIPFANLPSGAADLYLGSGGFGGGGVLAAGFGTKRWQVFANGGAEFTPAVNELSNLHGGTFAKANLGTGVALSETVALRAEATLNANLKSNEVPYTESPAEAILSARYRAKSGLNFTLGGATAITPGAGAARYRAFAGAGMTFGKSVAPAPVVAVVPCDLSVIVQDPDGKPIRDAQVTVGNRVANTQSNGTAAFDDCTPGMSDPLTATAPTFVAGGAEAFELAAGPNERVIVLRPMDSQLKVIVLDDKGLPHDARIRFLEGPADQAMVQVGPDGEETMTLKPGHWSVLVASPTHVPQEAKVELDPGEFETLTIHFTSDKPLAVCSETVVLHDVNFDFDIDTPREDSLPILRNIAASLKDCPEVSVEIGGHTDSKGSDEYNLDLSERRMNSVKKILASYGVADRRMAAKGYGESKPMATNNTDAGRALNRRVEFVPVTTAAPAKTP